MSKIKCHKQRYCSLMLHDYIIHRDTYHSHISNMFWSIIDVNKAIIGTRTMRIVYFVIWNGIADGGKPHGYIGTWEIYFIDLRAQWYHKSICLANAIVLSVNRKSKTEIVPFSHQWKGMYILLRLLNLYLGILLVTPCLLTRIREFIHTQHRNTTCGRRPSVLLRC